MGQENLLVYRVRTPRVNREQSRHKGGIGAGVGAERSEGGGKSSRSHIATQKVKETKETKES